MVLSCPQENPTPSRCLGVFGLSLYTTEQQINHIFSKYGPVDKVQVVIDAKVCMVFAFYYFCNYLILTSISLHLMLIGSKMD